VSRDSAVERVARELRHMEDEGAAGRECPSTWDHLSPWYQDEYRKDARRILKAARPSGYAATRASSNGSAP
jgi:hypothetical protein